MRKILVTSLNWDSEKSKVLKRAFAAAKKKYGNDVLVIVGYTAPSIKISSIAAQNGFEVQMFMPSMDSLKPDHLEPNKTITVTSTNKPHYMKDMVSEADGVIAFDKRDPVVMTATRLNKNIWFPQQ